ncbi:hypothetical protein FT643_07075 [Ketobacter sp. MCCC 1A13808]|uniref:hypothetical protein n=1 Tax=Ketobacter sp. MCCC 1A13808 TaxID=2602738 RepID=UPI000F29E8CA|nr:hypothetical protein [Ketobacter sp. MCCC 1A13808]MVF11906.1 hypothetical protein [Ketobacter sp. MCCC 1A13808]RLP53087.1 MAG: hypothetical protein D6160_17740 [Ketobacter sp.]
MRIQIAVLTGLLSTGVQAHPGHDHQSIMSDPIHLLTALAIAGVALVGFVVLRNRRNKNKIEEK